MIRKQSRDSNQQFAETSLGILTSTGEWFHTTSEQIEEFAPGLLDEVPLEKLIRDARAWVRSADSLSLSLLLIALFFINPWLAAIGTLAFHWLWYTCKSALVNRWLAPVFHWMDKDGYQLILALVVLSLLGMEGNYAALAVGVVFFFLFRLRLLDKLWNRLTAEQPLTPNDRVLKMVIIRHAMHEDMAPPSVQEMEERLKKAALKRKKGKS